MVKFGLIKKKDLKSFTSALLSGRETFEVYKDFEKIMTFTAIYIFNMMSNVNSS